MLDRLLSLRKLLWAGAIIICLFALFVGLIILVLTPCSSDGGYPLVELGGETKSGSDKKASGEASSPVSGELNELGKSKDAGLDYVASLYYLTDSVYSGLGAGGADPGRIWAGETGTFSVAALSTGNIIFPGDGSVISVGNAAMISKPDTLVLLVGTDGLSSSDEFGFKTEYSKLLSTIAQVSPETRIICCSICSITAGCITTDGLTTVMIENANQWLRELCAENQVYYADVASSLCEDGFLQTELAEADGRTLNSTGIAKVVNFLRSHSPD